MTGNEKRPVTWFAAFKALFRGRPAVVGKHAQFKAGILTMALVVPFIFTFQRLQNSEILSGAIPPDVPTIKATGTFVRKVKKEGIRTRAWIDFVTEDGAAYSLRPASFVVSTTNDLPDYNPPQKVYVEGFMLRNGQGPFWVTLVRLPNGKMLVKPEQEMENLRMSREGREEILIETGIWIFLCAVSFFNLYQLKRKLSTEE